MDTKIKFNIYLFNLIGKIIIIDMYIKYNFDLYLVTNLYLKIDSNDNEI